MSNCKFILFVICFSIFRSTFTMEEDSGENLLQIIRSEVKKQDKEEKKLRKLKNKEKESQDFFEKVKSEAELQTEFLTTELELAANQKLKHLINENEEAIKNALPEEKVVINGLMQQSLEQTFFYEREQDEAMAEALVQIASGVFKGIKNRYGKWGCEEGRQEMLGESLQSINEISNILSNTDFISYLFLTPEQRKSNYKQFYNCIESIKKTCATAKLDDCFEFIGEVVLDMVMLRGLSKIVNIYTSKTLELWGLGAGVQVARRAIKTGKMIEDLYANGRQRPIPNARNLPLNQVPEVPDELLGVVNKNRWKDLIIENNIIKQATQEEAIVGLSAESQNAVKSINRPYQGNGPTPAIDFETIDEIIDVKKMMTSFEDPSKFESAFYLDKIKKGLTKGETIMVNLAHLKKQHIVEGLRAIIESISIEDRMNKVIIALSNENLISLAANGVKIEEAGRLLRIFNLNSPSMIAALKINQALEEQEFNKVEKIENSPTSQNI